MILSHIMAGHLNCKNQLLLAGILKLFIFIHIFSSKTDADCVNDACDWEPWQSWSPCSKTCGGGIRYRGREFCCEAEWMFRDRTGDYCRSHCGVTIDGHHQYERCNAFCLHGGELVVIFPHADGYCECEDGYHGDCCEHRTFCGDPDTVLFNGRAKVSSFYYGGVVTYTCNRHYHLVGDRTRTCGMTGTWSGKKPSCVSYLNCASNPCRSGGTCVEGDGRFICECPEGWAGTLCELDLMSPKLVKCPSDIIKRSNAAMTNVSWPKPQFSDPMGGKVEVKSNIPNEEPWYEFAQGEHTVRYIAKKKANGLTVECRFKIKVLPQSCQPLPPPKNGAVACNNWAVDSGHYCQLFCKDGWNLPEGVNTKQIYLCGSSGEWLPIKPSYGCSASMFSDSADEIGYYDGNCMNAENQLRIKMTYLETLIDSPYRDVCYNNLELGPKGCKMANVAVRCG